MPPELGVAAPAATRERHLRLVPHRPLRVVDVALFSGEDSYALRTYLDAKVAFARRCGDVEHHLLVPGALGPTLPFNRSSGYRLPLGGRGLLPALEALDPDVVLLHAPFWKAREACRLMHLKGAVTVMVHHGFAAADGGAAPLYDRALRAWLHHTYDEADAVMAAGDPWDDVGRAAGIPLRFGIDPVFVPQPRVERGDHVLYAGLVAARKGLFTLVDAVARRGWPLRVIGDGPDTERLADRAAALGVALELIPFEHERGALARELAAARCMVVPEPPGGIALAALEAAACATPVVVAAASAAAAALGARAQTFAAGDIAGLGEAIRRARRATVDPRAAAAFAAEHAWERVLRLELRELEALARW